MFRSLFTQRLLSNVSRFQGVTPRTFIVSRRHLYCIYNCAQVIFRKSNRLPYLLGGFVFQSSSTPNLNDLYSSTLVADIIEDVEKAVVRIFIKIEGEAKITVRSGVIVDTSGWILAVLPDETSSADTVSVVTADGTMYEGSVTTFEDKKLSLVKISSTTSLPSIDCSEDKTASTPLLSGVPVLTVGWDPRCGLAAKFGIVRSSKIVDLTVKEIPHWTEVDFKINNNLHCGAPVFNLSGKMVGLIHHFREPGCLMLMNIGQLQSVIEYIKQNRQETLTVTDKSMVESALV